MPPRMAPSNMRSMVESKTPPKRVTLPVVRARVPSKASRAAERRRTMPPMRSSPLAMITPAMTPPTSWATVSMFGVTPAFASTDTTGPVTWRGRARGMRITSARPPAAWGTRNKERGTRRQAAALFLVPCSLFLPRASRFNRLRGALLCGAFLVDQALVVGEDALGDAVPAVVLGAFAAALGDCEAAVVVFEDVDEGIGESV